MTEPTLLTLRTDSDLDQSEMSTRSRDRSPPITAHLDSVSVLVLRNLNSECEGAGEAGRLSFISRSWFRSGVNRSVLYYVEGQ